MSKTVQMGVILAVLLAILSGDGLCSSFIPPSEIMKVSELKPGMKGIGKTVFKGTKVEEFQVEIIGVLEKSNVGGGDIILAKIEGGVITKKKTGVIAGMSGSPVYINGKLIGAIAFRFGAFAQEPIAGITPIEDMVKVVDSTEKELANKQNVGTHNIVSLRRPLSIGSRKFEKVMVLQQIEAPEEIDENTMVLRPVETYIMVSGMRPQGRAFRELERCLRKYNFIALPGPAGNIDIGDEELVPGAAVGVELVRGDLVAGAFGTLTYRKDKKVLAFGHPMLMVGKVDLPLTGCYVHDVLSSLESSFKLASMGKTLGTINQDRVHAIAGDLGQMPKMVPVSVKVKDLERAVERRYNVEVVKTVPNSLFAGLVGSAVLEAIDASWEYTGEGTAKVSYEILAKGMPKINREDVLFSFDASGSALSEVLTPAIMLLENEFQRAEIENIELTVELQKERKTARIERVFANRSKVEPGETVELGVVLRPYGKEIETKLIQVKIPKDMPDGILRIGISGGRESQGLRGSLKIIVPTPTNLSDLLKNYLDRERGDNLVVKMGLPKDTVDLFGQKLSSLPSTVSQILGSAKITGVRRGFEEFSQSFPCDWIVSGRYIITIMVQKKSKSEKPARPEARPPAEGPPPPPQEEGSSPPEEEGEEEGSLSPFPTFSSPIGQSNILETIYSNALYQMNNLLKSPPVKEKPKPEGEKKKAEPPKREEPAKKEEEMKKEKPLGRLPSVWVQSGQRDFEQGGTFFNTCVSSAGTVQLSPQLKSLYNSAEEFYIWSLVSDNQNNLYAGTGPEGRILKLSSEGKIETLFDSREVNIHCLVLDKKGNLYAGTSPSGLIYKISPDGQASLFYDSPEFHVFALTFDSENNLFVGTGSRGVIYRVTEDGKGTEFVRLPESHILSLIFDKEGNLYAGTADNGIIYKVSPEGTARVLYDAPEKAITCLTQDSKGNLYAGTSPKGLVYKITPEGIVSTLFDSRQEQALSLVCDKKDNLYLGTGNEGIVYKIAPDETISALHDLAQLQVLSMCGGEKGEIYLGCGNSAAIYQMGPNYSTSGSFESAVHDAGLLAHWGKITWKAEVPKECKITLQTRTGNSSQPDETWSPWSSEYSGAEKISNPPGRYIQYLAKFESALADVTPELKEVKIFYMTKNRPPTLKIIAPKGGEVWSGRQTIRWEASDPDKDTLTYEIYYSKDAGKTWEELKGEVKEEPKEPEKEKGKETEKAKPQEIAMPTREEISQMVEELPSEVPEEMKKKMLEEMPKQMEKMKEMTEKEAEKPAPEKPEEARPKPLKATSFEWDTKKFSDGTYLIKVIASDKTSNPTEAESKEEISEPVIIDNTAPSIYIFEKPRLKEIVGDTILIKGLVEDKQSDISSVEYRVDEGEWTAVAAEDGIFDSEIEAFEFTVSKLSKGDHKLEIRARDAADNLGITKIITKIK